MESDGMSEKPQFTVGQRVRVTTASGWLFAGPIQTIDDDSFSIRDQKTGHIVAFAWRALERVEELP